MRGKHANHRKGSTHPRWSNERMISSDGYVKLRVGKTHPLADANGYAYEHTVVWASAGHLLDVIEELRQVEAERASAERDGERQ